MKNLMKSTFNISLEEDIFKSVLFVHDVNESYAKICINSYISPPKRSQSQWFILLCFLK